MQHGGIVTVPSTWATCSETVAHAAADAARVYGACCACSGDPALRASSGT